MHRPGDNSTIDTSAVMESEYQAALANERSNNSSALSRLSELGGMPLMLSQSISTENPPEDRSMLVFMVHVCGRLMESSEQVASSIRIQGFWRGVLHKRREVLLIKAGGVIWKHWLTYRKVHPLPSPWFVKVASFIAPLAGPPLHPTSGSEAD